MKQVSIWEGLGKHRGGSHEPARATLCLQVRQSFVDLLHRHCSSIWVWHYVGAAMLSFLCRRLQGSLASLLLQTSTPRWSPPHLG
jgi:hypothetical protein